MDDSTTALAQAIGARVRHERTSRGWTLDQLAEAAGLSRRMVVNVEQGAVNPSVGSLLRLSDALGIGLPALVEPPQHRTVKVVRSGEGAALWSGDNGGRGVLVAGTQPPDVVELWDWELRPGERHESEAHTAGTRELLQVHAGRIVVTVGDEEVGLGEGDALTFAGDVPHAYAHEAGTPARFSLAVFEPGVGVTRTAEPATHGEGS
ncbi:helix-turn-helix domain-containing protein [Nocardioides jiangxiensis]|uniref:XRE family transcriptional regulator n=1 Tax=Nocardioides jiangxiensis TaxID=3064524 RepID=A0ABT9B066_9ACTN|nr:XRE family transcriptional regulator [Nocardioides sp. WY-20]MDO7868227.1 XRE family transcriptional regulator [Nocardioides sp. WY-20]